MGNNIGYQDKEGSHHGIRIGTNGSAMAVMRIFAVAYSASKLPDEIRARNAVIPISRDNKNYSRLTDC